MSEGISIQHAVSSTPPPFSCDTKVSRLICFCCLSDNLSDTIGSMRPNGSSLHGPASGPGSALMAWGPTLSGTQTVYPAPLDSVATTLVALVLPPHRVAPSNLSNPGTSHPTSTGTGNRSETAACTVTGWSPTLFPRPCLPLCSRPPHPHTHKSNQLHIPLIICCGHVPSCRKLIRIRQNVRCSGFIILS